jgi:hypothetical protein
MMAEQYLLFPPFRLDREVICIQALRKALGDQAQVPQFIETVPRRGYRFIASVSNRQDAVGSRQKAEDSPRPLPTADRLLHSLTVGSTYRIPNRPKNTRKAAYVSWTSGRSSTSMS